MAKQIVLGAALLLFIYVVSPFAVAVGIGAVFAVLFYPFMKRIDSGRFPNSLAAALFTFALTLLLFLPTSGMIVLGVKSGLKQIQHLKAGQTSTGVSSNDVIDNMLTTVGVPKVLGHISKFISFDQEEVLSQIKDFVGNLATKVTDLLTVFIGSIPNMLVSYSVFLLSLFYFLADGPQLLVYIHKRSLFNATETDILMTTFSGLCRSVILASIISGSVQALLAMIVSAIVGIKQFPLIFLIVFITSFVPLIGSFPVIAGMAFYQFTAGNAGTGITMAIAAIVIGGIDNLIRPQVIRGGSDLHPLLGFVSALGGLQVMGVSGVFLGPVICGLSLKIVEVVRSSSDQAIHLE